MKKIKVAEVITRLDWGGSPDIVRLICSLLDPEVYALTLVIGLTRHPSEKTQEFLKNFRQKVVFIPELKRNINPISDLAALIRLYFLCLREKFDIVHTHTAKAGALGRMAARLSGRPIIIHTLHGHNFYGYFGWILSKIVVMIERFLAYFTDKIIVLTRLEKKDLLRFKAADSVKIHLIYQGLELKKYRQLKLDKVKIKKSFNLQPDEHVVGMIGRLEPVKGPEYFIQAAKIVAEESSKIKFILVGEGSLRQRLEKQVEDLGLKNKFIFTGWREDIPQILSILDILVLPSLNEAVGMILIEAQSQGIPIVASNVGGIPEVVKDKETGILVSAEEPRALVEAITYLLAHPEKRLEMGRKAKDWVKNKFRAQDMVDEVSKLYQELIASRK